MLLAWLLFVLRFSPQVRGFAGVIAAADMETEVTFIFAIELPNASEH